MPAMSTLGGMASVVVATLLAATGPAKAQWDGVGSASFYWHNRYHGMLAMSAYGDYRTECPKQFTAESLQHQYPGNTNIPYEVIGSWGPTPIYKSEGYMVRVPEMNKILMVFKGIYGWENFNATLSPFLGIGCDTRCKAHTGALEAWAEVKAETNDMAIIKERQGDLVWSAAGHGFGGAIMQVAALDLKSRNLAFSAHSFGSPPVFNSNTSARWDDLFEGDASQRTVANEDSVPASIPINGKLMPDGNISDSEYVFVNTGIHVYGSGNPMYGQNWNVCEGYTADPRCGGGDNPNDHWFYYTEVGKCGGVGWDDSHINADNAAHQRSFDAAYNATATVPIGTPVTSLSSIPVSTSTSLSESANATSTAPSATAGIGNAGAEQAAQNTAAAADAGSATLVKASLVSALLGIAGTVLLI